MKKEDFQKWIKEDLPDNESEILEKNIMNSLLEHRLQQAFKERLQARRVRRGYVKWGLIVLIGLAIIGVLIYILNQKEKADLGYQEPIPTSTQDSEMLIKNREIALKQGNELISTAKKADETMSTQHSISTIINESFNIENKPILTEKPNLRSFLPPKDTEYIYLKSSSAPLFYPNNSGGIDAQDAYFDITFKDFSKQKLVKLPPSVFLYKQLKTLLLNNNLLTNLPAEMSQLAFLENLSIKNNKLEHLPIEIGQLKNLKTLDLSRNKLKELPNEMKNLNALEDLNLSTNRLSAVPFDFEELINLKSLNLRDNALTIFPLCIERMTNLNSLDLRFNRLTELPEGIGNLVNLTSLDLGSNRLKALPEALLDLKKLKFLNLSGNSIPASQMKELEEALPDCRILDFR
jgi:Leucine rich repeat